MSSERVTNVIDMNEADRNFKHEVAAEPGGEAILQCFQCGTCTVTCPVFEMNPEYDPRKIIRMVLLGLRDEVLSSQFIWLCSGCYSCYELCPRDVKITNVIGAIRNVAAKSGYTPEAHKASVELLEKFGRLLEISEFENTVRAKKEMPELEESIPSVKKVLDKTHIDDVVKGGGE